MGLASFRINDQRHWDQTVLLYSFNSSLVSSTLVCPRLPRLLSPSRQWPEAAGPSGPRSAQHPVPAAGPLRTVAVASAWPGASPGLASAQRLCPCVRMEEARIQGQDPRVSIHLQPQFLNPWQVRFQHQETTDRPKGQGLMPQ